MTSVTSSRPSVRSPAATSFPCRPTVRGRRAGAGARARILPLKAVEQLRPARDEIIIATGVRQRRSQVQYWGWLALGFLVERRQKG